MTNSNDDYLQKLRDSHPMECYRKALQKIASKRYGCCGADRIAQEALGNEATSNEPCEQRASGQDFDKDLARLDGIRKTMADMRRYSLQGVPQGEVEFLLSFIDNLWREYVRDSRDATRYRWLRTNVNSGVTVLFDSKEGPDGIEGFDHNDEDFDASIDRLMTANAQRT